MSPVGQVLVEEYSRGLAGARARGDVRRARQRRRRLLDREPRPDGRPHRRLVDDRAAADAARPELPAPARGGLRCARAVGVATGGANVQFAVDPGPASEFRVIEMNPRVSRSSALASKATGFPIAKLAALLAVGFTLDELPNDITGKTTAAFEPALDYVAVKAPRFDFEKFPRLDAPPRRRDAGRRRGARARPDVRRGVPQGARGTGGAARGLPAGDDELVARAAEPVAERWDLLLEAARRGLDLPGIHFATSCRRPRWREVAATFAARRDARARRRGTATAAPAPARGRLLRRRVRGADAVLLRLLRGRRRGAGADGRAIVVLGAGPNRIGQGDRVRLLLRPRRAGVPQARLRGGAGQLEPGDGLDRLRHLRPPLPRAARRSSACSTSASSSGRVGVVVSLRRPDAAAPRARRWPRAACRCSATRSAAIDAAEDRGRFARAAGGLRARVGRGRERATRRGRSRTGSATRCSSARTT